MTQKINIAHIGAGYWGKNIVRNLYELGVLHTLCDLNQKRLAEFGEAYPEVRITSDLDIILQDEDIAAVTVATPASTHYGIAEQMLAADKHVFVEKPLALQESEGAALAELADQKERILMVGHILRYHPAIEKIKELIDSGAVGRVGYCYSNRLNLGKIRKEENILWSFAPHDISILNFLMEGPPDEVYASGEIILQPGIHDITLTVLKWKSGVTAHINVSWLHPFKEHRFVVIGDKAMLVFDDTKASEKLLLYKKGIDFVKGEPIIRDNDAAPVVYQSREPLRVELQHFIDCVVNGKRPLTDAREGLDVLRVLNLAQKSLESNSNMKGQETDV